MAGPAPPKATTTISWAATPLRTCRLCGTEYQMGMEGYRAHQSSDAHVIALNWKLEQGRKDKKALQRERAEGIVTAKPPKPSAQELHILLDEHEEGILMLLCMQGRYDSSVELAADYYETNIEVQKGRALEWNLIELLLDDLNKAGLVVYRLASSPLGEVMARIRPTKAGYVHIAEKHKIEFAWVREVSALHHHHSHQEPPRRKGDMTDFRSFGYSAPGVGPIYREDFIEHCLGCNEEHILLHKAQLMELFGTDQL